MKMNMSLQLLQLGIDPIGISKDGHSDDGFFRWLKMPRISRHEGIDVMDEAMYLISGKLVVTSSNI